MVRLTVDNFDHAIILSLNHFCQLITDIASHSILIQKLNMILPAVEKCIQLHLLLCDVYIQIG